jgi:hypothetical protein
MRRITLLFVIFLLIAACSPVQPGGQLTVIAHPDGPLYVGDQVSFEVLAPIAESDRTGNVSVTFEGHEIGQAGFAPYGLGERNQASLWWVWDTHKLNPGSYNLTFTLLPGNIAVTETFRLRPANQVPLPEPGAAWV